MTRAPALLPDERVIARRPRGLKPLLTGIALTGLAGVVIFAAVSWAATGTVRERGLVEFLVIFTALNAVLHPLARRRMDYCLTDRRLLIGPDRAVLDRCKNISRGFRALQKHLIGVSGTKIRTWR